MEKQVFIKLILKLTEDAKQDKEKNLDTYLNGYFEGKECAYSLVAEWLKDVYCQ